MAVVEAADCVMLCAPVDAFADLAARIAPHLSLGAVLTDVVGPAGIGKSWIACAFGNQAPRDGVSVLYKRLSRLLEELAVARLHGRQTRVLKTLARTRLLILDDWAKVKLTAEQRRDLMEVIDDRHGRGSTIVATQIRLDRWHHQISKLTRYLGQRLLLPHQQRRAFRPARRDVRQRQRLFAAALRRWPAVHHEIRFDEPGCRVVPAVKGSHWNAAADRGRGRRCLASPAQGGVVRHRDIKTEKADERADQTFGLAQREVELRERQRRQMAGAEYYGEPPRFVRGSPRQGGNRLLAEPHRQIATLAQAYLVGWPIRQPDASASGYGGDTWLWLGPRGGHPGSGLGAVLLPYPAPPPSIRSMHQPTVCYDRIDMALDTFPYNGGTTAEALWQGVPVLTTIGDRWAARTSRSILMAANLADCVAADEAALIALATCFARDLQSLALPRATQRDKLAASAACDQVALCREGHHR